MHKQRDSETICTLYYGQPTADKTSLHQHICSIHIAAQQTASAHNPELSIMISFTHTGCLHYHLKAVGRKLLIILCGCAYYDMRGLSILVVTLCWQCEHSAAATTDCGTAAYINNGVLSA
eukprot:16610-Heterococcus_DN1.PRE.8